MPQQRHTGFGQLTVHGLQITKILGYRWQIFCAASQLNYVLTSGADS
jgi:hypothetical protein